jgi:hypothetical protein
MKRKRKIRRTMRVNPLLTLNHTILRTFPNTHAFIVEFTKRDALSNASLRIAISGSVMERDRTIMAAIFFGIWLKQTTRKFKYIQRVH